MKLASFAVGGHFSYGVVIDGNVVDAGARFGSTFPDLHAVIAAGALGQLEKLASQSVPDFALADVRLLKPIAHPGKILCVGVNYPDRNLEYKDGSEAPQYPSLFVRFPDSLVAHEEPLVRPPESKLLDYEGEIAIVIGRRGRRIAEAEALDYIAGYSIGNEGTIRDWLRHGKFNVTPGKNFERSGSFGPWMVTPDEVGEGPLRIITRVNGEVRQNDTSDHMIFSLTFQLSYISRFCTLEPGDIVFTGTPTGSGARSDPPRYLVPGDVVEVEVPGIGRLRNRVIDEGDEGGSGHSDGHMTNENNERKNNSAEKKLSRNGKRDAGGSPDAKLPEFSRSLPMALMRSREAVMRYFRPSLREHDVTEQQWRVLRALARNGAIEVTELSRVTVLLAPSLSRILRDLDKRGLIQRRSVKADLRRNMVSISAAGKRLIREVAPESEAAYAEIRARFGETQLAELHKMLRELEAVLAASGIQNGGSNQDTEATAPKPPGRRREIL